MNIFKLTSVIFLIMSNAVFANDITIEDAKSIENTIQNELQEIEYNSEILPYLFDISEISAGNINTLDYFVKAINNIEEPIAGSIYTRAIYLALDLNRDDLLDSIVNKAAPSFKQATALANKPSCKDPILVLLDEVGRKDLSDKILQQFNSPSCNIQADVFKHANSDNQENDDTFWQDELNKVNAIEDKEKSQTALITLQEEAIAFQKWAIALNTLDYFSDSDLLFEAWQNYISALNSNTEYDEARQNIIREKLLKHVEKYSEHSPQGAALALFYMGLEQKAYEVGKTLSDFDKDNLYRDTIRFYAINGLTNKATLMLEQIIDPIYRAEAAIDILEYSVDSPIALDMELVEKIARIIDEEVVSTYDKDWLWQNMVNVALNSGALDSSYAFIEKIQTKEIKVANLITYAEVLSGFGHKQAATTVVNNILPNILTKDDLIATEQPTLRALQLLSYNSSFERTFAQLQSFEKDYPQDVKQNRLNLLQLYMEQGKYDYAYQALQQFNSDDLEFILAGLSLAHSAFVENLAEAETWKQEYLNKLKLIDFKNNPNMELLDELSSSLILLEEQEILLDIYNSLPNANYKLVMLAGIYLHADQGYDNSDEGIYEDDGAGNAYIGL